MCQYVGHMLLQQQCLVGTTSHMCRVLAQLINWHALQYIDINLDGTIHCRCALTGGVL
jgi:hypothetical protein